MLGTAIELLPPEAARTEPWYEARRQGVTASEIASILGLSRFDSPLALYFRKRGELDDEDDNYRMALGRALEPYVLQCFTDMTGIETVPCGLVANSERPWQLATPDAVDGYVPVEGKTAVSEDLWGPSGSAEVPLYYRAQLLWQMDALGADHGYMCVVFMRSGEPRWYDVPWDGGDVAVMREAALEFLRQVAEDEPPDVDASSATRQALKTVFPGIPELPDAHCGTALIGRYRSVRAGERLIAEEKALVENMLRKIMGQATRLVGPDGEIVATRRIYERAAYYVKAATVDALYPGKDMKDNGG